MVCHCLSFCCQESFSREQMKSRYMILFHSLRYKMWVIYKFWTLKNFCFIFFLKSRCAMYSKHKLSLFKVFMNCFIRPRFICSSGSMILFCTTRDLSLAFCALTSNYCVFPRRPVFPSPVFLYGFSIPYLKS